MRALILLLAMTSSVYASEYHCSEWTRRSGVSCVFAGEDADIYERQCENACWRNPTNNTGNWGPNCDRTRLCFTENPENISANCSAWSRVHGVSCRNPNTDRWEQKWDRVCIVGLAESWCSDANPNSN